jgi:hypothetical protein
MICDLLLKKLKRNRYSHDYYSETEPLNAKHYLSYFGNRPVIIETKKKVKTTNEKGNLY